MGLGFLFLGRRGRGSGTGRYLARLITVFVKMCENLETSLIFFNGGWRGGLSFGQLEESFMFRHQLIIIVIIIQIFNPIIIVGLNLRLGRNTIFIIVLFVLVGCDLLLFSRSLS